VPLLVKLAPDLTHAELDDALDAMTDAGVAGVIATNTTLSRPGIPSPLASQAGGLSGAPLGELSTGMIRHIHDRTSGRLPIIGVGGVMCSADVRWKLDAVRPCRFIPGRFTQVRGWSNPSCVIYLCTVV
jgi:dihydroorotate dehydrogenase